MTKTRVSVEKDIRNNRKKFMFGLGDAIIGPLFIEGNLNGVIYAEMLEISFKPLIVQD